MIIEELREFNLSDQILDDLSWIEEVINQKPQFYTQRAVRSAISLKEFIRGNLIHFEYFRTYQRLRNECLQELQAHQEVEKEPNIFDQIESGPKI